MYQVQLVATQHIQDVVGQVTVDAAANDGTTDVKIDRGVASTNLFLKFCSFGTANQNCILVGSLATDMNGNADATLKFPQSGTWAGVFYVGTDNNVSNPSSNSLYHTEPDANSGNFTSTQSYRVALQPEANVTGGFGGVSTTPASLTSGFVSETGTTIHVEVHGAKPITQYDFGYCPNSVFGSGCSQYLNSTFTTDASGNGSIDIQATSGPSEVFFVDVHNTRGQGYVTAFVVQ